MKAHRTSLAWLYRAIVAGGALCIGACSPVSAQVRSGNPQAPAGLANQTDQSDQMAPGGQADAQGELQTGIALTQRRQFREAIPHFLAARGRVSDEYAENFNLALCYVATNQPKKAIEVLNSLHASGHDTVAMDNLLAQAYVESGQSEQALEAFQKAAALTPENEKLYLFVADACISQRNYSLGLTIVDLGLQHLPQSATLHYDRGAFLVQLDRFDLAKSDFDLASKLAPGSDIAYMALGQKNLQEGNIDEAIRVAREGVNRGVGHYILLQILGEALIRSGISPGQPEFAEARAALEKSVAERPDYSASQISLGKMYLMEGRLDDAIAHLEAARESDPRNTAVYSHLAVAYRRKGELKRAQDMLAILAKLNQEEVEKVRTEPGETKGSYVASGAGRGTPHKQ